MPNTYTQLYVQVVFAVKGKASLIQESQRIPVEKYICGIVKNQKCKPLAIYCNPDHLHLLFGIHPSISISGVVQRIKIASTKYIKSELAISSFLWQDGYGAFSYSRKDLDRVLRYILNQRQHHAKQHFKEEILAIFKNHNVDYNKDYLFDFI